MNLIDIYRSVINNIKKNLINTEFDTCKITSSEIEGTIIRPSLSIDLENYSSEIFSSLLKEKTLNFNIYFFAKDRYKYKIDNIKMIEVLEKAFSSFIQVKDLVIDVENLEFIITDTVLNCTFDLKFLDDFEIEIDKGFNNQELMGNLFFYEEVIL